MRKMRDVTAQRVAQFSNVFHAFQKVFQVEEKLENEKTRNGLFYE